MIAKAYSPRLLTALIVIVLLLAPLIYQKYPYGEAQEPDARFQLNVTISPEDFSISGLIEAPVNATNVEGGFSLEYVEGEILGKGMFSIMEKSNFTGALSVDIVLHSEFEFSEIAVSVRGGFLGNASALGINTTTPVNLSLEADFSSLTKLIDLNTSETMTNFSLTLVESGAIAEQFALEWVRIDIAGGSRVVVSVVEGSEGSLESIIDVGASNKRFEPFLASIIFQAINQTIPLIEQLYTQLVPGGSIEISAAIDPLDPSIIRVSAEFTAPPGDLAGQATRAPGLQIANVTSLLPLALENFTLDAEASLSVSVGAEETLVEIDLLIAPSDISSLLGLPGFISISRLEVEVILSQGVLTGLFFLEGSLRDPVTLFEAVKLALLEFAEGVGRGDAAMIPGFEVVLSALGELRFLRDSQEFTTIAFGLDNLAEIGEFILVQGGVKYVVLREEGRVIVETPGSAVIGLGLLSQGSSITIIGDDVVLLVGEVLALRDIEFEVKGASGALSIMIEEGTVFSTLNVSIGSREEANDLLEELGVEESLGAEVTAIGPLVNVDGRIDKPITISISNITVPEGVEGEVSVIVVREVDGELRFEVLTEVSLVNGEVTFMVSKLSGFIPVFARQPTATTPPPTETSPPPTETTPTQPPATTTPTATATTPVTPIETETTPATPEETVTPETTVPEEEEAEVETPAQPETPQPTETTTRPEVRGVSLWLVALAVVAVVAIAVALYIYVTRR